MNFLAHLFLAEPTDESRIGGILADFTVGRIEALRKHYGPEIARGIQRHRDIDRFTDSHPAVLRSIGCLQPEHGIFSGIIVDVVYDYFLLKHWDRFSPESVEDFLATAYQSLQRMEWDFPEKYQYVIPRMIASDWLLSYRTLAGIDDALSRMSSRFSRRTSLDSAIYTIRQCYNNLDADFLEFFPELMAFMGTPK